MRKEPTQEFIKEYLNYDPNTGIFTWTEKRGNRGVRPNRIAGCDDGEGYIKIRLAGVGYKAHRLAWIYMTGNSSDKLIDHINRNSKDNRWENLREADHAQSVWNTGISSLNKVGYKGVAWDPVRKKYFVRLRHHKKRIFLGRFNTAEEAHAVYCDFVQKNRGEFGCVG
jgi:hypothetical protein